MVTIPPLAAAPRMSSPDDRSLAVTAGPDDAGERLDKLVTQHATGLSRARVQALIRAGAVSIGGETIGDVGHRVKPGDRIELSLPEPEPAEPRPEAIPLTVVFEDRHLIVVDKPAGLVVHPAAGHAGGTLVNALIAHCGDSLSGIGGVRRPGIVHRLDKDTSGLLVVAKTDAAHQGLAAQFEAHGRDGRLSRRYLALVWGAPERPAGRIEASLERSERNRLQMAVVREGGRTAVTHWSLLRRFDGFDGRAVASLLALELETGRTHQIRVHMSHVGHPVMADPVYGTRFKSSAARLTDAAQAALAAMPGQALHAAALGFEHPTTGRQLHFEAAPPPAFAALLAALGSDKPAQAAARTAESGRTWRRKR